MTDERVIRLVGLATGEFETPADGTWVVAYNPSGQGFFIDGERQHTKTTCMLHVTREAAKAKRFDDAAKAFLFYKQDSGRTRDDGRPDRPLTAYTVEIVAP